MKKRDSGFDQLAGVDEAVLRQEKTRARELRKSRWWQQKTSGGRCQYCGATVPPGELTMDHIVPLAMGGTSSKGNIAACCKACNTRKKTMMPIEWQHFLEKQGQSPNRNHTHHRDGGKNET